MINRLIELSLRNRFIVTTLFIALAGWGWWAVRATPIDAIPDLSDEYFLSLGAYKDFSQSASYSKGVNAKTLNTYRILGFLDRKSVV